MLKSILDDIQADTGLSDPTDRNLLIKRVNDAIREIHDSADLREALDERVFDINVLTQQVTLPAYIEHIRGVRFHDGNEPVELNDLRNRYNYSRAGENETWYLRWRDLKYTTLSRSIENESTLKISVPIAEEEEFTVTVVGETTLSAKYIETLTFPVGTLEMETVGNYTDVTSITKNILTKYDLIVTDAEDNILATIPNSEYTSRFKLVQILDTEQQGLSTGSYSSVEVQYKVNFVPLINEMDSYLGTDKYDKAIYWKYMEITAQTPEASAGYAFKCEQALARKVTSQDASIRRKINFKPRLYFHSNLPYTHAFFRRF